MSVAVYNDDELCRLWGALGGEPDAQTALARLAYANRAAHMLTYGDKDFDMPTLAEPIESGVAKWAETREAWVQNLLYNCVSNGGTNYAPPDAAEFLLRRARGVQ